jgi:uncharacterized repeat protein (TIGR01451 family)
MKQGSAKRFHGFLRGLLNRPLVFTALLFGIMCLATMNANAAGTPAGTIISNKATVSYTIGTNTFSQDSNTDTITIVSIAAVYISKAVLVIDQYGGSQPITGATIRYTLTVTAAGSGTAMGVVITDLLPTNTTYTPGTLKLNGVVLSDAADGDAGDVGGTTAGTVTVKPGDLTSASPVQTITFDVKIN